MKGFFRTAKLEINNIYGFDKKAGTYGWRNVVKAANEQFEDRSKLIPENLYQFDTNNFLYGTARAISSFEKWGPNGNADGFPWEEILKALPTYPGCGMYVEHKEDSEDDAKGIVLTAVPNNDDQYVTVLFCIDKNLYPELCAKILSGELSQVSMSCYAQTAVCGYPGCGNVARSNSELCQHMNKGNPITYMKGKHGPDGNIVYEMNKDIIFAGLSFVSIPADKNADIFSIKASQNKKNVSLKNELNRFRKAININSDGSSKEPIDENKIDEISGDNKSKTPFSNTASKKVKAGRKLIWTKLYKIN